MASATDAISDILKARSATSTHTELSGNSQPSRISPWPLTDLFKAPQTFCAEQYKEQQVLHIRSLIFDSVPHRGKPTKVFAYYSAPSGVPPKGGWPAIVIAHGGGGTAYPDYVKMWNDRDYAAIAMDFYGKLPGAFGEQPTERKSLEGGYPYASQAENPAEEWTYHVVATIVLAHSLLRNFPEINPEKTGLVGTSWGGVHSCIAAALDWRFKFAVSIYGCGFLSSGDESCSFHQRYKDALPWWDPSHFLPQVRTPFFWIGGTNDEAFSPDMWQKSINATPGTIAASLVVNLGHSDGGHTYTFIANIAESMLKKGARFPQLKKTKIHGQKVNVRYTSEKPLARADLCYTTDCAGRAKRVWETKPAKIANGSVTATIPNGTTAFFFNVYDASGTAMPEGEIWPISSEYVELVSP